MGWFALVSDLGVKVAGFANLPGLHWFVAQLVLSQVGGQVDRFAYRWFLTVHHSRNRSQAGSNLRLSH